MSDAITYASMKELKIGRYVLIEDIPCKVVDIEVSSPGKHGSAKMRITAIGIFNGQKKTLLKPSDADVEVPIIDKKKAQVVSIEGDTVQLMDLNTYEVYSVPMIDEFRGKLKSGNEVEVLEAMGKRALSRILTE
ncbi:MAG: translation initiation factor IF-5A [Candidatus Micrarchaeaceae archaeon]